MAISPYVKPYQLKAAAQLYPENTGLVTALEQYTEDVMEVKPYRCPKCGGRGLINNTDGLGNEIPGDQIECDMFASNANGDTTECKGYGYTELQAEVKVQPNQPYTIAE